MNKLFDQTFFRFVSGFLLILIAALVIIVGVRVLQSDQQVNRPPAKATTTTQ